MQNSGTPENLIAVWGVDAGNIWAVGRNGMILHWDGQAWNSYPGATWDNLFGVWSSDSTNIWTGREAWRHSQVGWDYLAPAGQRCSSLPRQCFRYAGRCRLGGGK
jgi:hypothetical protein